jgi:2-methylisocitrate lyase-like PEP mutase family enzyme
LIAREKKAREQETRAKRVREFRQLHRDGIFIIPNPWDAGSAKILASMGYKALATTSAGYSYSRGVPDSTLTLQQTLVNCREIVAATTLPVSADLENGYGPSPEQVKETVRAAAEAGLAGGSIEDASGDPDSPIYDLEHACERISAAVEARAGLEGDFVLTARAENYLYGKPDIDDTIARLKRFEEAGADVLYERFFSCCRGNPGQRNIRFFRKFTFFPPV